MKSCSSTFRRTLLGCEKSEKLPAIGDRSFAPGSCTIDQQRSRSILAGAQARRRFVSVGKIDDGTTVRHAYSSYYNIVGISCDGCGGTDPEIDAANRGVVGDICRQWRCDGSKYVKKSRILES